jgi:hypothetical protein
MFGCKRKPTERLPWYRVPNYDGDLKESEKRQLDAFRMQEKHPADTYESLPEEVQNYIIALEMDVYDNKQQSLAGGCLLVSGFGAFSSPVTSLDTKRARGWGTAWLFVS